MSSIKITFLGQCFVFGYRGVARWDTYPEVARRRIQAERPDLRVVVSPQGFYHPADLVRQASRVLQTGAGDILVIDAAANVITADREAVDLGGLPAHVRGFVETVRQGRSIASGLVGRRRVFEPAIALIETAGRALADSPWLPFVRRYERSTLLQYEAALKSAVLQVQAFGGPTLVLQGPSAFNPDESHRRFQSGALAIYRDVNEMVRRVATTHGVMLMDRTSVASGSPRDMFLDADVRLSALGHQMMGHALAEMLLGSGRL